MNEDRHNPNDPLPEASSTEQHALFKAFGAVAVGASSENVIGASVNIFVNAIRQSHPLRRDAEARFNELMGRYKQILLDHYDGITGKRKSIFPFNQVIRPSLFVDKDDI